MKKRTAVCLAFACLASGLSTVSAETKEYSLKFDSSNYVEKTMQLNGKDVKFSAYEKIVYVKNPVDIAYESMNVYVPAEYYEGKSVNGYTAKDAPIFFPNSVGGYMPGEPGGPGQNMEGIGPNASLVALSRGYVVAAPGARGRTTKTDDGVYTGKAPACIVDLKAAVRYLRYNDKDMPGDAEKIISNGTSAGGALSALLGASGNNKDYEPYLKAIGAADARDDIYAASCYCPITNLDNADAAYEWLFNGVNDYRKIEMSMIDWHMERKEVSGTLTADQVALSGREKILFPSYLNSLGLKAGDGSALALDSDGNGAFRDYVKSFVITSAQTALDAGTGLSSFSWITVKNGKVSDIDFPAYLQYITRMKIPSAFDGLDLSVGENGLFGTSSVDARHFTKFGQDNDTAGGTMAEANLIKIMNPMNYIGTANTATAKYWRIRHGTKDRDTSLAVPVMLATKLQNNGYSVDFAMPWERPHSGDYDLDELFAWADGISHK